MRSLLCAAAAVALLPSAPAFAAEQYRAVPLAQPDRASFVTRDVIWKCNDGTCIAGSGRSRPEVMCERIVQRVGALREFTVADRPLAPAQLAKCNARAE